MTTVVSSNPTIFVEDYLPPLNLGEWDGADFAWEQVALRYAMTIGKSDGAIAEAMLFAKEIGLSQDRERQVPAHHSLAEATHMARYLFASRIVTAAFPDGIDLSVDYGSGAGYGLKILEPIAQELVGIDCYEKTVQYANKVFGSSKIRFHTPNDWNVTSKANLITCFEMLEHVSEEVGKGILANLHEDLKEDGFLLISTPRRPYGNPFHIHEYTLDEFQNVLKSAGFSIAGMFGQCNVTIEPMERLTEQYEHRDKFTMIALCRRNQTS